MINTGTILPAILVIFVILMVGLSFLAYYSPNTIDSALDIIVPANNDLKNLNINNKNIEGINNETIKKAVNVKNKKIKPQSGYSKINIHGLDCFVKSEYTNFTEITDNSNYDGIEGYLNLTANNSTNFIDYKNFGQLVSKNGSFEIFVTSNSKIQKPLDRINYEYATNNVANDTTIKYRGHDIRIVQYTNYANQNSSGEMIWAYFEVNGNDVAIGWEGNSVDMYVIKSFFILN